MKVLVAYEETYRFYRSVIAKAIEDHRPHLLVCSVALEAIEVTLVCFDPHVVICSRPSSEYSSGDGGAWVELPAEPTETGVVCLGGDYEETVNPQLVKVLSVLGESGERLRRGTLAESC